MINPLCLRQDKLKSLKCYIVEDSQLILEHLTATLEELAPVVVVGTSTSECEAAHWLLNQSNDWDMVIVDVFLRAGSGLGLLRALASASRNRKRVIFSNYATAAMRDRCISLGADRVFDKSQEIDALIDFCTELAENNTTTKH